MGVVTGVSVSGGAWPKKFWPCTESHTDREGDLGMKLFTGLRHAFMTWKVVICECKICKYWTQTVHQSAQLSVQAAHASFMHDQAHSLHLECSV